MHLDGAHFGARENWALPQFWCVSGSRTRRHRWRVGQHAGAEKIEASAPIHLTLDHLESVNLALDLAGAPGRVDRGANCGEIFLQAVGKADDATELTASRGLDPLPQFSRFAGTQSGAEGELCVAKIP